MEYFAIIAICLGATPVTECGKATALHWLPLVEASQGLAGCMRDGMVVAARSHLLKGDDYPKVFCRPSALPIGRASAEVAR